MKGIRTLLVARMADDQKEEGNMKEVIVVKDLY